MNNNMTTYNVANDVVAENKATKVGFDISSIVGKTTVDMIESQLTFNPRKDWKFILDFFGIAWTEEVIDRLQLCAEELELTDEFQFNDASQYNQYWLAYRKYLDLVEEGWFD